MIRICISSKFPPHISLIIRYNLMHALFIGWKIYVISVLNFQVAGEEGSLTRKYALLKKVINFEILLLNSAL